MQIDKCSTDTSGFKTEAKNHTIITKSHPSLFRMCCREMLSKCNIFFSSMGRRLPLSK